MSDEKRGRREIYSNRPCATNKTGVKRDKLKSVEVRLLAEATIQADEDQKEGKRYPRPFIWFEAAAFGRPPSPPPVVLSISKDKVLYFAE